MAAAAAPPAPRGGTGSGGRRLVVGGGPDVRPEGRAVNGAVPGVAGAAATAAAAGPGPRGGASVGERAGPQRPALPGLSLPGGTEAVGAGVPFPRHGRAAGLLCLWGAARCLSPAAGRGRPGAARWGCPVLGVRLPRARAAPGGCQRGPARQLPALCPLLPALRTASRCGTAAASAGPSRASRDCS